MLQRALLISLALIVFSAPLAYAIDQRVVMDIHGMACELCSLAIKRSLEEVEGVKKVKISYREKKVYLVVEEKITDEALEKAVSRAGDYKGTVVERKSINR